MKSKKLVIMVGISGCGKSMWLKGKTPVVETDAIRKAMFKNVNTLTKDKLVFEKAKNQILKFFEGYDTVYMDATMVQTRYRANYLRSIQHESEYNVKIDAYIFSCDPVTCKKRVKKDLDDDVNRADTLDGVIDKQYGEYLETLNVIHTENVFDNIYIVK